MVDQPSLLILALLPAIASALGGITIIIWSPTTSVESAIQHFAAGAVLAAVAELLADLQGRAVWLITTGLIAGVLFVLFMEWGTDTIEERATASSISSTAGLLTAMGVDTLLDGFLAGLIVGALAHGGAILVLAFAVEMLSFGLAAGAALPTSVSSTKLLGTTAGLGVVFPIGMPVGVLISGNLSGVAIGFIIALGVSVLLYLVTDELLAEAREEYESTGTMLTFFAGFIILYVLSHLQKSV